jgi:predicted nucleic acid-binding protein
LIRWIAADGLDVFDVRPEDVSELLDLLERYRDAAMDLADASLVLLASHIGIREILTVDRRDFEVYRLLDGREFVQVLP